MAWRSIRGRHVPIAQLMGAWITGHRLQYGRFARRPDASCEAMGQTSESPRWRLGSASQKLIAGMRRFTEQTDYGVSLPQNAESNSTTWRRRFFTCRPETADGFWVSGPTQFMAVS
jgi:hypothetical protein